MFRNKKTGPALNKAQNHIRLDQQIARITAVVSLVALIASLSMSAFTTQAYVALQWPTTPLGGPETSVIHGPGDQLITKVIETDTSSRIVVWYEDNDQSGGSKVASIKAQKYDNTGAEEWAAGGVTIDTGGSEYDNPYFIPVFDGVGGVFVIFQRYHVWNANTFAAQVNSAGTLTAPVDLLIPHDGSSATLISAIPDYSTGGFIYSYAARPEIGSADYLLVQTANSSMVNQWNVHAHVDCDSVGKTDAMCGTQAVYEYDGPYTSAGDGKSYQPYVESLNMLKSGTNLLVIDKVDAGWASNDYILANSINLTTGARAGAANILLTATYSSIANQKIITDAAGGAYIVWRNYINNTYDYLKIDSSANTVACPGAASTIDTSVNTPSEISLVKDGAGGFFAVYKTDSGVPATPTRYLNVAKVSCTGVESIATNTIKTIAPGGDIMANPRIVGDGTTGAFITWLEGTSGASSGYLGELYGQHINSALNTTFASDFAITSTGQQMYSAQSFVKNSGTPGFVITATIETAAPNADAITDSYGGRGLYDNFIISVDDPDLVAGGTLEDFSWTPDTVSITTASPENFEHDDANQKSLKTAGGDYIVAWTSRLGTSLTVRAQKYDTDGVGQWNGGSADGVVVGTYGQVSSTSLSYDMVMSGSDVLFLIAEANLGLTLRDNIAVKLSGTDGSISSGPNTITKRSADRTVYIPQLIEDGSGGAFAIWGEQCPLDVACGASEPNASNDTVVSHLTSSAAVDGSWNTAGGGVPLQIDSDTTSTPANTEDISTCTSRIVSDGAGGFIGLVLASNSSRAATCTSGGGNNYIIASRYSANGITTYDRNTVASGPGSLYHFDAISDGSNGAILSYNQVSVGEYGTYSQRINGSGTVLFPFGSADAAIGQPIAAGYGGGMYRHEYSQIVSDESGTPNGGIITWNYTNNNTSENSVLAQRIDEEGTIQWGNTGVPVSPGDPYIVVAGEGDPGSCGAVTTFTKTDYGSEIDGIVGFLALTRGDNQGLYNPLMEGGYGGPTSPRGTEWAAGACLGDVTAWTYGSWVDAVGWNPSGAVGSSLCMHDTSRDGKYYNILMNSWTQGDAGGGFSYDRCEFTPGAAVPPFTSGTPGEGRDDSMQIETYDWFWFSENKPYTQSIAADGSGGAYIAYMTVDGGEEIVSAQNINSSGVRQFDESETYAESTTLGTDQYPIVMAGSIIVLWQNATGGLSDIYGQSMATFTYIQPTNDTIEIHAVIDALPSVTGMGISNGDDSGTNNYSDLNWNADTTAPILSAPPEAPFTIDGASSYEFTNGEPTQTNPTRAFDSVTWIDVPASGGGLLTDADDQYSTDIPLGFTVTIYGKDVDTIRITTDGFVYLNDSADISGTYTGGEAGKSMTATGTAPFNASVDGSATGDILVAAAWNRLDSTKGAGAAIHYYADAANEIFLVEYIDLEHFDSNLPVRSEIKIFGNGVAGDTGGTGACGAPVQNAHCELLTLGGSLDIWFNGYADDATPTAITFDPLTAGTTTQYTVSDALSANTLTKAQLIGVINLKDAAWDLQVQESGLASGSDTIPAGNLTVMTTADSSQHFAAVLSGSDLAVDHEGNTPNLTLSFNEVFYGDPGGGIGYTYADNDVASAVLNNSGIFNVAGALSDYFTTVNNTSILSTSEIDAQGIFAIGVGFQLTVPGSTPAGAFTGDITYTAS